MDKICLERFEFSIVAILHMGKKNWVKLRHCIVYIDICVYGVHENKKFAYKMLSPK